MSLQHFSHQHPLVFIESQGHEIEKVYCSGCGELVSGSSFACVECGFYLHKHCAEAPAEMNHPFHRNHNLNLLTRNPYKTGTATCDFCRKPCENFVYHCSCNLNFHIKCALFSHSIAEKRNAEFQDIPRIDPSINTGNVTEELKKAECFACWKPLLDSVYFSPNCGFYLHAKCVDLPAEINHLFHQEHPLFLIFNSQRLSCKICQKPQRRGFVYCCSLCKFALHIQCATIPTKINRPFHRKHPLILQSVDECLPCQICQETTNLNDVVYFCSICKFVLHIPVLNCLLELNIVLMYILSNSLITRMMKIIQKVIIVIFVKRKGIPNIGFIIVQLVTLQLIPNVFLKNIHLSSLGPSTKKKFIHIISLLSKGLSFIQNVIDVVNTALICPFNVRKLDAAILFIGSVEDQIGGDSYFVVKICSDYRLDNRI
ncbi:hypothetical protein GOBAR_DD29736 [Gossypium barbadense]|nr:hypothetical protein GOBAR_DD29736 [Gossypium barbadense]